MKPDRIALVDIGTNTTKFLTVRLTESGFEDVSFTQAPTRLGRELRAGGRISPEALTATAASIRRFRDASARGLAFFGFATQALRGASNASHVTRTLERALGTRIHILSGKTEARFAALSAFRNLRLTRSFTVLVDTGGGSTELAVARQRRVVDVRSCALGALHLTERFIATDPPSRQDLHRLSASVRRTVDRAVARSGTAAIAPSRMDLVVSGGSAGSAVRMLSPRSSGDGLRLGPLVRLRERCAAVSLSERRRFRGLEPDRADIIVAGLTIVIEFMRAFRKRIALFNHGGVRHGAIIHLIENDFRW